MSSDSAKLGTEPGLRGGEAAKSSYRVGKRVRIVGPVVVWLLAGFAIHVLVHQLNLLSIGGFPAGYYLAAQAAPLILASVCFWIALRRRRALFQEPALEGLAAYDASSFGRWVDLGRGARAAGAVLGGGILVALTGAAFGQGYDGFAYLLGLMSAIVAVAVFYVPALSVSGATSFAGYLRHQFGSRFVSVVGGVIAVICLVLLLSAELLAIGTTLARMLAISARDGILLGTVALIAVSLGVFILPRLLAFTLGGSILAIVGALSVASGGMSLAQFNIPVPQLGYGLALPQVTGLERHLLLDGLADPVSLKQHIRPRTHFDIVNFFAIAATFAVGFGALAALALVRQARDVFASEAPRAARLSTLSANTAWLGLFACLVVVTVPALATLAKLGLLQALAEQIPLSTLPTWVAPYVAAGQLIICGETDLAISTLKGVCNDPEQRLGLQDISLAPDAVLLAASEFSGAMGGVTILLAVVICIAGLACGTATVCALGCEIRDSFFTARLEDAPEAPLLGRLRGVFVVLVGGAVAAGVLVALYSALDALLLICVSASLAAACLFPATVIGGIWGRVSGIAVGASLVTGLGVCAYYVIGTTYFADMFALTWQVISSAPEWQIEQLRSLQVMCSQANVGECAQLPSIAREAANWFGVETSASALFALPASLVVLLLFAVVAPRRRSARAS